MLMPFGTITAPDARDVFQATTCWPKIKHFREGGRPSKRGREVKIRGPPLSLSNGYMKMFEKVRKNGDTGGRKSKDEQEEVNKKFVETYPRGCHKRKCCPISTTDVAPTNAAMPPKAKIIPPKAKIIPPKAKMPKNEEDSKKEEGGNTQPQSKSTIKVELRKEVVTLFEQLFLCKEAASFSLVQLFL